MREQPASRLGDRRSVDACPFQEFRAGARARHAPHGKTFYRKVFDSGGGEAVDHGRTQSAFGVVILRDDDAAVGRRGSLTQRRLIDGFDAVEIDHTRMDTVILQKLICVQRGVQRDAGTDERDLIIIGGVQGLRPTHGRSGLAPGP